MAEIELYSAGSLHLPKIFWFTEESEGENGGNYWCVVLSNEHTLPTFYVLFHANGRINETIWSVPQVMRRMNMSATTVIAAVLRKFE